MLKIVPDPPLPPHYLEDSLVQASEHVNCAMAVAHQYLLLSARSPGSLLVLATLHELESVRKLLDAALSQVQSAASPTLQ